MRAILAEVSTAACKIAGVLTSRYLVAFHAGVDIISQCTRDKCHPDTLP